MFSERIDRYKSSLSIRITFWYLVIFILSSAILLSVAYHRFSKSLRYKDRELVQSEALSLKEHYQEGGLGKLQSQIELLEARDPDNLFFASVLNPSGSVLYFHLPKRWTPSSFEKLILSSEENEKWHPASLQNGELVEVLSLRLLDENILQFGRSNARLDGMLYKFRNSLLQIGLVLVVLGFLGGLVLSRRALLPLRELLSCINSAKQSNQLQASLPVPKSNDEFRELVLHLNSLFGQIDVLVRRMRDALDNVAHDLRTPITRCRVLAEAALKDVNDPQKQRDALMQCMEECENVIVMLNTLMDISEAETGLLKLDCKNVDLKKIILDAVDLYQFVAEEKNILMETNLQEGIVIFADEKRMRQVFANLIDNAIKYTLTGGKVRIQSTLQNAMAHVCIEDNGMGIGANDLPRIWEKLYRTKESLTQRGLGLGLSLVRAIVKAHHGSVSVVSQPNKGSKFYVYLPLV